MYSFILTINIVFVILFVVGGKAKFVMIKLDKVHKAKPHILKIFLYIIESIIKKYQIID